MATIQYQVFMSVNIYSVDEQAYSTWSPNPKNHDGSNSKLFGNGKYSLIVGKT